MNMRRFGLFAFAALANLAQAQSLPPIWDGPPPPTLKDAENWPLAQDLATTTTPINKSASGTLNWATTRNGINFRVYSSREVRTGNYLVPIEDAKTGQSQFKLISASQYAALQEILYKSDAHPGLWKAALKGNPLKAVSRVGNLLGYQNNIRRAYVFGEIKPETKAQAASLSNVPGDCLEVQRALLASMISDPDLNFLLKSFNVTNVDAEFLELDPTASTRACKVTRIQSGKSTRIVLTPSIRSDLALSSCKACDQEAILSQLREWADLDDAQRAKNGFAGPAVESHNEQQEPGDDAGSILFPSVRRLRH